tara:strand:- start:344 stop:733 length:390 start_codon:yes stop_codon:yes gene_type:complete
MIAKTMSRRTSRRAKRRARRRARRRIAARQRIADLRGRTRRKKLFLRRRRRAARRAARRERRRAARRRRRAAASPLPLPLPPAATQNKREEGEMVRGRFTSALLNNFRLVHLPPQPRPVPTFLRIERVL